MRELCRNANKSGHYNPDTAQNRYLARRRRGCILDRLKELGQFVIDRRTPPETSIFGGFVIPSDEKGS